MMRFTASLGLAIVAILTLTTAAPREACARREPGQTFAYVDHLGRFVYQDERGHFYVDDGGERHIRILPYSGEAFAYHDAELGRDVWTSCAGRGARSGCSHFYVTRHGRRVFLD